MDKASVTGTLKAKPISIIRKVMPNITKTLKENINKTLERFYYQNLA